MYRDFACLLQIQNLMSLFTPSHGLVCNCNKNEFYGHQHQEEQEQEQ